MTDHTTPRYGVNAIQDPGGNAGHWYIYDRTLRGECGLPVAEDYPGAVVPLRWPWTGDVHGDDAGISWRKAHQWLTGCYVKWGRVPSMTGPHPADVDWEEVHAAVSRAARGQMARESAAHEHLA